MKLINFPLEYLSVSCVVFLFHLFLLNAEQIADGTLRIDNNTGLVEIYKSGWGYICDYFWNIDATHTACRQLEYRRAKGYLDGQVTSSYYDTKISHVRCLGNQLKINDCDYLRPHVCGKKNKVKIICDGDGCESLLVNSERSYQIAYYYNNKQWHYICGDDITMEVADVICKETAKTTAISFKSIDQADVSFNYSIYLRRFDCNGNETSLCNCTLTNHSCPSRQILQIQCNLPENGNLRLSDGHQGTLSIYRNGWKFVVGYPWNTQASETACRTLGFRRSRSNYIQFYVRGMVRFGGLNGAVCFGNETNILQCEANQYSTSCYRYINLTCETDGCESFVPNADEKSTVVQYYTDSHWYYICAENFSTQTGGVICHENTKTELHSITNVLRTELPRDALVYNYSFNCRGDEPSLCNCTKQHYNCKSEYVASVRCHAPDNGSLRLLNGNFGELQIYKDGWTPICDIDEYFSTTGYERWSFPESNVACRNLGFRRVQSFNSEGNSPFLSLSYFLDFRCFGNETKLSDCFERSKISCSKTIRLNCTADGCESFIPYAEGREVVAQIYTEGAWYTLCADGFTQEAADVICRENGHLMGALSFSTTSRQTDHYPSYPFVVNCTGFEKSICECTKQPITCLHNDVIAIQCRNPVPPYLRLSEGSVGELLVKTNGWGYVSASKWNIFSSEIACREMGFLRAISYTVTYTHISLVYPINIGYIICGRPDLDSIFNCYYNNRTFRTDIHISLKCQNYGCESHLPYSETPLQEVRIFTNKQWHYICADGLTKATANVICKENRGLEVLSISEVEPSHSFPIYQYIHECDGSESSLCNCTNIPKVCSSNTVAAIECIQFENGDLRLTGGTDSSGILEIFLDYSWGYVNNLAYTKGDDVACRKLGFKRAFGVDTLEITSDHHLKNKLRDLKCAGSEDNLLDCGYSQSYSSRSRSFLSNLTCQTDMCETYPQIFTPSSTTIHAFKNNTWFYICADGFTKENAQVVCRENAGATLINFTTRDIPQRINEYQIEAYRYSCVGNEASLCNCSRIPQTCQSNRIVNVSCNLPQNGDTRLAHGYHGLFEIYFNGWGYVCGYNLQYLYTNLDLACRINGFTSIRRYYTRQYLQNSVFNVESLQCSGEENSLQECKYSRKVYSCSPSDHLYLVCNVGGCKSYAPLSDTKYNTVQFYNRSQWHYICADGISAEAGQVVCRENAKGSLQGIVTNVSIADLPKNAKIYNYTFSCQGDEDLLCDCVPQPFTCRSEYVISIRCNKPEPRTLRLEGGNPGRLQFFDGPSICDFTYRYHLYNRFIPRKDDWAGPESAVACRDLGYRTIQQYKIETPYFYSKYHWANIDYRCFGNETSLKQCYVNYRGICPGRIRLGCVADGCESLIPYAEEREVIVRMYTEKRWYVLCGDGFTKETADVICRENGHSGGAFSFSSYTVIKSGSYMTRTFIVYPYREFPIYSFQPVCKGSERSVCDCKKIPITCTTNRTIAIQCHSQGQSSLRLSEVNEGQLLVNNGGWGYVGSSNWTQNASEIACREMGFGSVSNYTLQDSNFTLTYPIRMGYVDCTRNDYASIFDCNYRNTSLYSHGGYYVSLKCNVETQELVRVFGNKRWNYACFEGFSRANAFVTCRANGYLGVRSINSVSRTMEQRKNLEIYQYHYKCRGSEGSLCDCPVSPQKCTSDNAVSVECQSSGLSAEITSPSENIIIKSSFSEIQTKKTECVAFGYPMPDVYWTQELRTRLIDSKTLQINITNLSRGKTFYCIAENTLGKDIVSVTYELSIMKDEAQNTLQGVLDKLNNSESISPQIAGNSAELAKVVIDTVNDAGNIDDQDKEKLLDFSVELADRIIGKIKGDLSEETARKITGLLSSIVDGSSRMQIPVLRSDDTVAVIPKAMANALTILERFSIRLAIETTDLVRIVKSGYVTIVAQNIFLRQNYNESNPSLILPMRVSDDAEYSVLVNISTETAHLLSIENNLTIATSIIEMSEMNRKFPGLFTQISDLITISVAGYSGTTNFPENVTLSFKVSSHSTSESTCVFLNDTRWVSKSLTTDIITKNLINCNSPHLTSFAVLAKTDIVEPIALYTISYLFAGFSFISLIASLILFFIAGKTFFKVDTNILYFNYCLSMLLATGLFIFGIHIGTYNVVFCKIIAFFLHYSWLTVFTWTLCIGIFIMYKIKFGVNCTKKMYFFIISFGWGVPGIISITTIAAASEYYLDVGSHCFLSITGGVIWAFIIPILFIIATNSVFFTIALFKVTQDRGVGNKNIENREVIKNLLITGLIMTTLLGLPWIFHIFNIVFQHHSLEWAFIIINGLMGVVFLIVVSLRIKEVKHIFIVKKHEVTKCIENKPESTQVGNENPSMELQGSKEKLSTQASVKGNGEHMSPEITNQLQTVTAYNPYAF